MKYGILGDIHANLSALETALKTFEHVGVEVIVSVGDVVGYGAAPRECIRLLRDHGARVVLGNHDAAAVGLITSDTFNPAAALAVRWTAAQLGTQDRDYLSRLPLQLELDHACVAHATWKNPERFDYMLDTACAEQSLSALPRSVCFLGHTHRPLLLGRLHSNPARVCWTHAARTDVAEWYRLLVNVGSVGQPRDDDPRAAIAIYDSASAELAIHRLAYDVEREQHRIRHAGLPEILAERLALGF